MQVEKMRSEDRLDCDQVTRRFIETLLLFGEIADGTLLSQLKMAVAALSERKTVDSFGEVASALRSVESVVRGCQNEINSFLTYAISTRDIKQRRTILSRKSVCGHLTVEDTELLWKISATLLLVASLLHECAVVCETDTRSIHDISDTVSLAVSKLSEKATEFQGTDVRIRRLVTSMEMSRLSIDKCGRIIQKTESSESV